MTQRANSAEPVTIVMVHGAWADGSSWGPVIAPLQQHGLAVRAAPLPLTSLADDVAALDRVLERIDGPVILAGHAYAGAVIASARAERVRSLVFVAALAPDEGETVMDVFQRAAPHPLAPQLAPDQHGAIWLPDEAFPIAFAQHAPVDSAAVLAAVQRPIHLPCIGTAVGRPLWRDRPSWFLVAEDDRMIAPETQRFMATRMGATVRTAPVDHTPLVSAPEVVVEIILEAVNASA
jgi:pimeloyl-ACP methyl ester carboxylesterase